MLRLEGSEGGGGVANVGDHDVGRLVRFDGVHCVGLQRSRVAELGRGNCEHIEPAAERRRSGEGGKDAGASEVGLSPLSASSESQSRQIEAGYDRIGSRESRIEAKRKKVDLEVS